MHSVKYISITFEKRKINLKMCYVQLCHSMIWSLTDTIDLQLFGKIFHIFAPQFLKDLSLFKVFPE